MPDWNFQANTKEELDAQLREIIALDNVGRGDEIYGSVTVTYSDDDVLKASLVRYLGRSRSGI